MKKIARLTCLCVVVMSLAATSIFAIAGEGGNQTDYGEGLFIPAVYDLEGAWNTSDHKFTAQAKSYTGSGGAHNSIALDEHEVSLNAVASNKPLKWSDELLNQLPYKNTLKYSYDYLRGDTDVMDIKDLRVDLGNQGLKYKTNYIPFAGEVEGAEIEAEMGKDMMLKFESDYVPMVGRVDGLKFNASYDDNASVSLRYKIKID